MISWLKKFLGNPQSDVENEPEESSNEQPTSDDESNQNRAWIGVDLDGTLAKYSSWKGIEHVGKPIPLMQKRVMQWIEAGHKVKILTARASIPEGIPPIQKWLKENGFPNLEITCQKDFQMIELWDDRAIQVVRNTGKPVIRPSMTSNPQAPLFKDESDGETFEFVPTRNS
ncbi:hypothetical protein MLD52_05665 [Puniceicoccaceae bacterium K14]|nr:hypothetical protein [Puniceicoccaceae bacterium K14]